MKNIRNIIIILALLVLVGFAGWYFGTKQKFSKVVVDQSSETILNRIDKVFKMVAVEGHVSEVFDYKDYQYFDFSIFRKKILVRVNAKVLVGYDFDKLVYSVNEDKKLISIDSFPEPSVLAVDHNLDYYDIEEGTFNRFSEEKLTDINRQAKEFAAQIAENDALFNSAEEQKKDLLDMFKWTLESAGWTLVYPENLLLN